MRFHCQPGCIRCCEEDGFVYLTADDIVRMSAHLKISRVEFRRRYVCGEPPLLRFRLRKGRPCPFLLANGCSIHEVKPLQCSSFPCWPELLDKPGERRRVAKYCPGMERGPSLDPDAARLLAEQVRTAFPAIYQEE